LKIERGNLNSLSLLDHKPNYKGLQNKLGVANYHKFTNKQTLHLRIVDAKINFVKL